MDPALRDGAASADVETRRRAALALGENPGGEAVAMLGELLGDPNWRVRKAAVESILVQPPGEALALLLEALHDHGNAGRRNSSVEALTKCGPQALFAIHEHLVTEDVDVKLALLHLLGDIPSRENALYLVYYLNHEDKNLVSAAIASLGKLRDPANLALLMDLVKRQDDWLWFHLVEAFADIGGPQAHEMLCELYQVPRLRKAVLKAFGHAGVREAVPFVLERLNDPDAPVLEIMATLGQLHHANMPEATLKAHQEKVAEEVRQHFPLQRVRDLDAAWQEAKVPERRGMILVAGFLSELSLSEHVLADLENPYLQRDAFRALHACGPAAVRRVIRRLNASPSLEQRVLLIQLLAASGSEEAVVPIISQAREDDFQIRTEALLALGVLEFPKAASELLTVLKEEDDTFHETALGALRSLVQRRPEFLGLLEKPATDLLGRPGESPRRAGFALVAQMGPGARERLLPGLGDPSPSVRQSVVNLVAQSAGDAVEILSPLLKDPDPKVRRAVLVAAGRAIAKANPGALGTVLDDPDVWVRSEAAYHLTQAGDAQVVGALLDRIWKDEPPVRIGAVRGLAEVGCGGLFDRVLAMTRSQSETVEVRQAALTSIARSGQDGSREVLVDGLRHPRWEIRSTAIHLMGDSGDRGFIPYLLKELERDPDALVRQAVVEALIRLKASEAVPRLLHYLTDPVLKEAAYRFFVSLGRPAIRLIENEAQSVDFQTKVILIDILKHLENQ
jgi:HEAT repeat protein